MGVEKQFRVIKRKKFLLKEAPTKIELSVTKSEMKQQIQENIQTLAQLQEMLYAQDRKGVLIIFQAMDAAGKDSMIKHVMSGINPQGCTVTSFKQPSTLELDHDFMWRVHRAMPRRGEIGIFNRSYYEDVLVTKVHPDILLGERLPGINQVSDVTDAFYKKRYQTIKHFEKDMTQAGFTVLKFFLHLSKDEQKNRFLRRIQLPDKHWKFSAADMKERAYWEAYQLAYEQAIRATSTKKNPWYVIPADDKWTSRLLVSEIINERLTKLDLGFPEVTSEQAEALKQSEQELQAE